MLTICLVQVADVKALHALCARRQLTLGANGVPVLLYGMFVFGTKTLLEPFVAPLPRGAKREQTDRDCDD